MKFKDFQAPVLFSSTFKALNLGEKKFKYFQGCMGTLSHISSIQDCSINWMIWLLHNSLSIVSYHRSTPHYFWQWLQLSTKQQSLF